MKNNLFSGKSTRTKIFTVITVVGILLLLALNLLFSLLGIYNTAFIDMTPEGLYTLRPVMVDACRDIFLNEDGTPREKGIKITFCDDPDNLISKTVTRVVYYMAIALSKEYSNFEVETVNIDYNPTAVAMYKTTSLTEITSEDVIISYGSRYRITSAESFWRISNEEFYSFDGEFKLASIMLSLTLVDKPVAYFVTDHGEDYYNAAEPESAMSASMGYLADLLTEKGLGIGTLSLSGIIAEAEAAGKTPALPEDCIVLIINNPKTDFRDDPSRYGSHSYVSETELIDRYLTVGRGSVMVSKDYKTELPVLEDFLSEWGMDYSNTLVKDDENYIINDSETGTTIVTSYNTNEESYAYGVYGDYAASSSSPRTIISDTGHIICSYDDSFAVNESGTYNTSKIFASFLNTSDKAIDYAMNPDTGRYDARASQDPGAKTVAAICGREVIDGHTGDSTYSYLFCAASADFFSGELLGNTSYANYDVVSALVQNIARLDTYASMELGGVSVNNYTGFGGKPLVTTKLSDTDDEVFEYDETGKTEIVKINYGLTPAVRVVYTVIIVLVPLSVAIVGVVVCLRRKFL